MHKSPCLPPPPVRRGRDWGGGAWRISVHAAAVRPLSHLSHGTQSICRLTPLPLPVYAAGTVTDSCDNRASVAAVVAFASPPAMRFRPTSSPPASNLFFTLSPRHPHLVIRSLPPSAPGTQSLFEPELQPATSSVVSSRRQSGGDKGRGLRRRRRRSSVFCAELVLRRARGNIPDAMTHLSRITINPLQDGQAAG